MPYARAIRPGNVVPPLPPKAGLSVVCPLPALFVDTRLKSGGNVVLSLVPWHFAIEFFRECPGDTMTV